MTRIVETADGFVDDALEGFALVHANLVRRVDGGVVRAQPLVYGTVAVVVGGGSGHYPAFAGLVGPGLAAAAVCGNIFSSPSSGQAYRVAQAAQAGAGVLFSYGNYAGDVLHFDEAQRRLNAEGIETRTVLVTDDVASAPANESSKRRGIAGDLCVFRIASAAAEQGSDLDEVERLAVKANDRTRSLGVAFAGCTLPGATEPLFVVPEGMMSVGLGIHGEPGIRDVPLQSASELAATLCDPLLAERPAGSGERVVPILNGLGSVKYEELFVLYRFINARLAAEGLHVVQPECGELVTSLDMAGVSLTLLWLDEELEQLWSAPVYSPAYRTGSMALGDAPPPVHAPPVVAEESVAAAEPVAVAERSAASAAAARVATDLIGVALDAVRAAEDDLGALDAIAGDGDHGVGMVRGLTAAHDFARSRPDLSLSAILLGAGDAWSERAGGTSGALWGAALGALGDALGERDRYTASDVVDAVTVAVEEVQRRGGAALGDKTMVDALVPFAGALTDGGPFGAALARAALAATLAAAETADLTPRRGRARPLAERSVGHPDPGATSFALMAEAIASFVAELPYWLEVS
jgi:D-erythrulose 4-kinase